MFASASLVAWECAWQAFAPVLSLLGELCLVVHSKPPLPGFPRVHSGQSPIASQCLLHSAGTLPVQLDQWERATAGALDQSEGRECAGSWPQCHHINIGEDFELETLILITPPPTCQQDHLAMIMCGACDSYELLSHLVICCRGAVTSRSSFIFLRPYS